VCSAVAVAVVLPAGIAHASFPGSNGRLALGVNLSDDARSIVSINPDGTGKRCLANCSPSSPASADEPQWTPDGRWLRFLSNSSLAVMAADGSRQRLVPTRYVPQEMVLYPSAVSPDGRDVVFHRPLVTGSRTIWRAALDGTGERPLGKGLFPKWSPDGRLIAYLGVDGVWVANAQTGELVRRVIKGAKNAQVLDWAPNGRKLLWSDGRNPRLWIASVDGKRPPRPIEAPPSRLVKERAVWSPDGRQIAFGTRRYRGNGYMFYTVWTMSSEGTNLKRIYSSGWLDAELSHIPTISWQPLPR
jgi:Tol biopolymer transport system component